MKTVTHTILMLSLGAALALASNTQPNSPHRLAAGDQVVFSLSTDGAPAIEFELKLNALGQLDLPLPVAGAEFYTVRALGRTPAELASEAQAVAAQHAPGMLVRVESRSALETGGGPRGRVTFCGEAQGVIFLERQVNTHLAQAVNFLGPSRFANLQKVRVSRALADGATRQFTVDVEKIMADGFRHDIPLQPGDIVSVPASRWPGGRPATDRPALPVDDLKLFCALSHGRAQPLRASAETPKPAVVAAVASAPAKLSQLAAR